MKTSAFQVTLQVRECSRRILDLCKDRELLKKERADAKGIRNKIVGMGNTVDSFGDKYQSPQNMHRSGHVGSHSNIARRTGESQQTIEPYDPYRPSRRLGQRVGNIIEDVEKIEEGDNAEVIKKKIGNGGKKDKSISEKEEVMPDVNFLD